MSPKELKKLADMCRKAGIKHFKNDQVEFTLADEVPESTYKKAKKTEQNQAPAVPDYETDALSREELLLWSVSDPMDDLETPSE